MLKKFLSTAVAFCCISFSSVAAQEVTVSGMGADKDEALRDASRLAVEQVVGTYIDSRMLIKDLMIQLDEVYKKSNGYIKNIKILSEEKLEGSLYRVTAMIDVDTTPDGNLIDEITMIMQLNDPRIAVLVFDTANGNFTRYEIAEGLLNEKLISMNFSHILNSSMVASLNNGSLLESLATSGNFNGSTDNATDYLVIGKYSNVQNQVYVPSYEGMKLTNLWNCKSTLKVEICKYDTGEIVGTFVVDGSAVGNSESRAQDESLRNVSVTAAGKLAETFKKFSSKTTQEITVTISADSESNLQQIINELRLLGVVDSVYIREQKGNYVVLAVESSQKPNFIVTALKNRTPLEITVEEITNSTFKLKVN